MRRTTVGPLICALFLISLIDGEVVAATAADRIVEVTVFPDRAEVVREIRVDLPRGRSAIAFENLPHHVDRDSLRVTARGVDASLGMIELRASARQPAESPEMIAVREQVRGLESALAILAAEDETDAELRSFLAALKATTTTRESKRLGDGEGDPAALQATYLFVQSSLQELGKRNLARAQERNERESALALARARLEALAPGGPIRVRVATVEVTAAMAGSLTVRLAYLTPGASWRPGYRASLDATTDEIRLDTEALVRQDTGEDWSGVSLRLSTAAPARGVRPPVLEPWLLRPLEIVTRPLIGIAAPGAPADAIAESVGVATDEAGGSGFGRMAMRKENEASRQTATIVQSSYNIDFEVPGESSIPADNADHLVALRRDMLRGEMEYQIVPMLSESAYLVAKTRAPVSHPLLAGPIHLFAGAAYLGAAAMPETGPGGDLTLPFGSNNRILVRRTRLPREQRDAGVTGRDRRIGYGYRTTVENRLGQAVDVVVEERLPVSEDARIEVENGKSTTPGGIPIKERPGVLRWKLRLEPGVAREIALDYAVRYPDDIVIAGLQ